MSDKADVRDASEEVPATTREELAAQVAELEETVQTLNNLLSSFSARMLRNVDDLKDEMNRRVTFGDLQPIQKDLQKVRDRIDDIVDEVGYGDALDIAKVPSAILEAAYQAILDDVVGELKEARGAHDAEQHILRSLEELRMKTSGSELFHYRPHRIHVGVAKVLEKGLVSARQVQMTFEELLRHLLEPIHYHQPRNFRALIKIKSQEYAVATALALAKDAAQEGGQVPALQARVQRVEEQLTGTLRDLQELVSRVQSMLGNAATQESVEALGLRLAELERRLPVSPAKPERAPVEALPRDPALSDRVRASLSHDARSLAALKKELGADEGAVLAALADLEARGLISTTKRGRYTMYRTKEDDANA